MSEGKDGFIPLIVVPIPSKVYWLHIMPLVSLYPQRDCYYTQLHDLNNSIILAFSSAFTIVFTDLIMRWKAWYVSTLG